VESSRLTIYDGKHTINYPNIVLYEKMRSLYTHRVLLLRKFAAESVT